MKTGTLRLSFVSAILSSAKAYEICSFDPDHVFTCYDNATYEGYCCYIRGTYVQKCCYNGTPTHGDGGISGYWYYVLITVMFVIFLAALARCISWNRDRARTTEERARLAQPPEAVFVPPSYPSTSRPHTPPSSPPLQPPPTSLPPLDSPLTPPRSPRLAGRTYSDDPPSYSQVAGDTRSDEYRQLLNNYLYERPPDYQASEDAAESLEAASQH